MKLKKLLKERDALPIDSVEWNELDFEKSILLESEKPSLKEEIVAFVESSLTHIPNGFTEDTSLLKNDTPYIVARRSRLEYHPLFRQPIPYACLVYQDKIFVTARLQNSGENRLLGKFSFLGGHVQLINAFRNLDDLLENELIRELNEEIGFERKDAASIKKIGLIKENESVGFDHLGIIYIIECLHDNFEVLETEKLVGKWFTLEELCELESQLETWALIIMNYLKTKEGV